MVRDKENKKPKRIIRKWASFLVVFVAPSLTSVQLVALFVFIDLTFIGLLSYASAVRNKAKLYNLNKRLFRILFYGKTKLKQDVHK